MNKKTKAIMAFALVGISSLCYPLQVNAQNQKSNMNNKKVTDGRDYLGDFAPKFAEVNDDVLFGEIWSRESELPRRDRSLITVAALMGSGITDGSLKAHLEKAKENGVTKSEMVEIITQLAFYTGWPKAWAVFFMAKEVYKEDAAEVKDNPFTRHLLFGLGEEQPEEYSKYFKGKSYANMMILPDKDTKALVGNVTFEPGSRNCWHSHNVEQILMATDGRGWYQEWNKPAQLLKPGDVVLIKPNTKHWHGATKNSWFTHIAIEGDAKTEKSEWFEMISDEEFNRLHE